ncbi:unnamed protein product, partial [Discosporangium mesarthrocarpum]
FNFSTPRTCESNMSNNPPENDVLGKVEGKTWTGMEPLVSPSFSSGDNPFLRQRALMLETAKRVSSAKNSGSLHANRGVGTTSPEYKGLTGWNPIHPVAATSRESSTSWQEMHPPTCFPQPKSKSSPPRQESKSFFDVETSDEDEDDENEYHQLKVSTAYRDAGGAEEKGTSLTFSGSSGDCGWPERKNCSPPNKQAVSGSGGEGSPLLIDCTGRLGKLGGGGGWAKRSSESRSRGITGNGVSSDRVWTGRGHGTTRERRVTDHDLTSGQDINGSGAVSDDCMSGIEIHQESNTGFALGLTQGRSQAAGKRELSPAGTKRGRSSTDTRNGDRGRTPPGHGGGENNGNAGAEDGIAKKRRLSSLSLMSARSLGSDSNYETDPESDTPKVSHGIGGSGKGRICQGSGQMSRSKQRSGTHGRGTGQGLGIGTGGRGGGTGEPGINDKQERSRSPGEEMSNQIRNGSLSGKRRREEHLSQRIGALCVGSNGSDDYGSDLSAKRGSDSMAYQEAEARGRGGVSGLGSKILRTGEREAGENELDDDGDDDDLFDEDDLLDVGQRRPYIKNPTWLGPLEPYNLGGGAFINPFINQYLKGYQREGV